MARKRATPTPTVGAVFGDRLRAVRTLRGLRQDDLAKRLEEMGHRIHRTVLAKMEKGAGRPDITPSTRAENISVADLFAIAAALNCSPLFLVTPSDSHEQMQVTSGRVESAAAIRAWVRGAYPLPGDSEGEFYIARPPAEIEADVRAARLVEERRRLADEAQLDEDTRVRLGTGERPLSTSYTETTEEE